MGRTYSPNGYLNAILRRSGKTILVEGPTDKGLIHRLFAGSTLNETSQVDHGGMISGDDAATLGNKAKILLIRELVHQHKDTHPKLTTIFSSLVDREWDDLDISNTHVLNTWKPPTQTSPHFVTIGHSVENYYYDPDYITSYLRFNHSEHLSARLEKSIQDRFDAILKLSAAASIQLQNRQYLGRASNVIKRSLISFQEGLYSINNDAIHPMTERGIEGAQDIIIAINTQTSTPHNGSNARWLAHGHIGSEIIWSCIAHLMAENGISGEILNEVEFGRKDQKEKYFHEWLSRSAPDLRTPLDTAIAWLSA